MALHRPSKDIPLHSIILSRKDITKIFDRLWKYVDEEIKLEIGQIKKPEDKTDAEFEADIEQIRKVAEAADRLWVTITGRGNESIIGSDIKELFKSPTLPDAISSIYMSNIHAHKATWGQPADNTFELFLDFSKPPLLDSKNPVSIPTLNGSNLSISGHKDAWVALIEEAVVGITKKRRNRRTWLHRAFMYDTGQLLLGLPAGLYICWKLSGFIDNHLGTINLFLSSVAYVYIILLVLYAYRIFFGYTKWAFPTVELEESRDNARTHRSFWYAILLSIIAGFVGDLINQF